MARTRRSEAEMIALEEAKIESRKRKLALKEIKDDPRLGILGEALEQAEKNIAKVSALLGDGPQSLSVSEIKHKLWLVEIAAKKELAEARLDAERYDRDFLKATITNFSKVLNDGEALSEDEIQSVLDQIEESDEIVNLKAKVADAQDTRKMYSLTVKAGKKRVAKAVEAAKEEKANEA